MEKKILILASTSFIGKNIKKYFENKKYTNLYFLSRSDCNFKNIEKLQQHISKIDPEIVINCCGIVGSSVKNNNMENFDILNDNILLNANVLNSCKNLNVKKIIMFSTYRLFGDDIHDNYSENDIQSSNISSNIGYLTSKKILDLQIQLFVKENNINVVCLLLTNIFGENDQYQLNSRIVPSLICKINKSKIENTDIEINVDENTLVNLIYADDVSNIVEQCIDNNSTGNIITFNKNGIITLKKLIGLINKIFNNPNKVIFNNCSEIKQTFTMNPNIDKFEYFFPNFKFTEIECALNSTIVYFMETNKNI